MLRISKQVDYGILLLAHCAAEDPPRIHSTRDLANQTGLPVPMVSKILKGLAREGILNSFRGTKGGYTLARDAAQITVAAIVRALEGPVRLVDCASDPIGPCRFQGQCRVVAPMQVLARAVHDVFERTTLEDLIALTTPHHDHGNGNGNGASTDAAEVTACEDTPPAEDCSWPTCSHEEPHDHHA